MTKIVIDEAETMRLLEAALKDFALNFGGLLADASPKDLGELQAAILASAPNAVHRTPDGFEIVFSMPPYAEFLEFGTGEWGPSGKRIVPTSKKALAWRAMGVEKEKYGSTHAYKGFKNWYAFKSVRGIDPGKWMFIRPTFHKHFIRELRAALIKRFPA